MPATRDGKLWRSQFYYNKQAELAEKLEIANGEE